MTIPTRCLHITEKIDKDKTGLKGSLFVHVDFLEDDKTGARTLLGVRFSEKRKDGSTLDGILTALGDTLTAIVRENINGAEVVRMEKTP